MKVIGPCFDVATTCKLVNENNMRISACTTLVLIWRHRKDSIIARLPKDILWMLVAYVNAGAPPLVSAKMFEGMFYPKEQHGQEVERYRGDHFKGFVFPRDRIKEFEGLPLYDESFYCVIGRIVCTWMDEETNCWLRGVCWNRRNYVFLSNQLGVKYNVESSSFEWTAGGVSITPSSWFPQCKITKILF